MKSAVLADIHGNLAALEAVLKDIQKQGEVDQYWSLGDILDYGPEPQKCLERMRQTATLGIVGNHEYAVAGKMDLSGFQSAVTPVTRWTKEQLDADDIHYVAGLPLTISNGDFTLAHGSPRDPIWEYILSEEEARRNLSYFQTRYCLVGHTHVPLCFEMPDDGLEGQNRDNQEFHPVSHSLWDQLIYENRCRESVVQLTDERFIINPGSVGQPRDNDPRAAYAIYDSAGNTLEFRRVEYDIRATQRRMVELKLPDWLIERLAKGE
jgi:diadenosine tetraphosphatase ApaH/serine/threonine PP2A family protein phosphatase